MNTENEPQGPPPKGPQSRLRQTVSYQVRGILRRNCDGSFAIQRKREQVLLKFFKDLRAVGYKVKKVSNVKPKHVEHQVAAWRCSGLAPGTLKNNLSILRWLCCKIGKSDMLPSNDELGIERRAYLGEDKAWKDEDCRDLLVAARERNERLWYQMRLMRAFGLRFKEAALFRPHADDLGTYLHITHGTKGGRERQIPVRTGEQLALLNEIKAWAPKHESMLHWRCSFKDWRAIADADCQALGLSRETRTNFHALRHRYAQERYQELTGLAPPCKLNAEQLAAVTPEMQLQDRWARQTISSELGHGRIAICRIYLGPTLR